MQPVKTNTIPLLPVLVGIMILIPLLVVAGCTGQAPAPRLEGTGWTLTGYMDKGTMTQPLSGTKVTLDFSNDGQISGNAGCNHYFASSTLKGTTITIGPGGSTEMYCVTPGVMDQESAYLSLLSQAKIITLTVDTLILSDTKGSDYPCLCKDSPACTRISGRDKLDAFILPFGRRGLFSNRRYHHHRDLW